MSALEKFQEWSFFFNFVSCIIFFILTFMAMGFYPGGSRFDSTRPGYNIIETALSDLGGKIAFNNEPNTI